MKFKIARKSLLSNLSDVIKVVSKKKKIALLDKFLFTIKFYSHISFQVCYNKKLSSGQGSRLCRRVTWRGNTGFLFFLWNGKNRYAFLVDRIILL